MIFNLKFEILISQFLPDQNDQHVGQKRPALVDHQDIADPSGNVTIHAFPCFGAGNRQIKPLRIQGGGDILYPLNRLRDIFNNFINACNKNDFSGAECHGIDTIPDTVDIDQLSIECDGVSAAKEEIGGHFQFSNFKDLFLGEVWLPMVINSMAPVF